MCLLITPFIDREYEMKWVLEWFKKGFYPIMVVYGPEGCGKTRLLLESINRVRESSEYFVLYINALEERDPSRAFYGSDSVLDIILNITKGLSGVGAEVARALSYWFKKLVTRIGVRGKHVVIVVDDVVKAIGLDYIDVYCKKLLDLMEELYSYNPESVTVVVTTSEGLSRERLLKHRWATEYLLWNLGREEARALLESLGAPSEKLDEIILYTGGNPRAIIELWRLSWDIRVWTRKYIEIARTILSKLGDNEISYIEEIISDPDKMSSIPSSLYRLLLEYNIVIELPIRDLRIAGKPEQDRELGIGEYYAFQLPVYMHVFKELLATN